MSRIISVILVREQHSTLKWPLGSEYLVLVCYGELAKKLILEITQYVQASGNLVHGVKN